MSSYARWLWSNMGSVRYGYYALVPLGAAVLYAPLPQRRLVPRFYSRQSP